MQDEVNVSRVNISLLSLSIFSASNICDLGAVLTAFFYMYIYIGILESICMIEKCLSSILSLLHSYLKILEKFRPTDCSISSMIVLP